jgi:phage terminase large subunit-like protein
LREGIAARVRRQELLALLEERERRRDGKRTLKDYAPYAQQAAFHRAGAGCRERLFMAGNQLGKTKAGASEWAMHLTGRYPAWWQGRRFDRPVRLWAAGVTAESTRDNPQRLLIGPPGARELWGSGAIPRQDLLHWTLGRGLAAAVDTVAVRHASGGQSFLAFKSYEKGREKWQGETLDGVWFDEEPPLDIYSEGLTRTSATGGLTILTFTPLLGMSEVVRLFLADEGKAAGDKAGTGRSVTRMTIDEALHFSAEERSAIVAAYPAHEREARAKGRPQLGSGRIFAVAEENLAVPAFALPTHWPRLGALDFGWEHPTAALELAWDREGDCLYVTRCYRVREATPVLHAAALKAWGTWLPWAWPHDGNNDTAAGENLATQYRAQGLRMLGQHAQFEDGSRSVEAGIMQLLDRMLTGRLKVFDHLNDWFEEFRLYHRKDGRVVKEHDDLMSATRYGAMSLRFARLPPGAARAPVEQDGAYDPISYGFEDR